MISRHLPLLALALGVIKMSSALGAEEPAFPTGTEQEQQQADTRFKSAVLVKDNFGKWFQVGNLTFVMERTTLDDVIHALGSGTLKRNGRDAAEGEFRVDYTDGIHLIRFSSSAEMGGEDHELEGIEIRPLARDGSEGRLPRLQLPISFSFGAVPMTLPALEKKLGPSPMQQGFVSYRYLRMYRSRGLFFSREHFEVLCSLTAKVEGETVTAVELSYVTAD